MFSTRKLLVLADVTNSQNSLTGDRTYTVSSVQKIICNENLVGMKTLQLGSSQGISFNHSLEIDRMYYKEQKYCYYDNTLYAISGISKAKYKHNMLLNVSKLVDDKIKTAIEDWLEV